MDGQKWREVAAILPSTVSYLECGLKEASKGNKILFFFIYLDSNITLIQMNFDITRLSLVVVEPSMIYLPDQLEEWEHRHKS